MYLEVKSERRLKYTFDWKTDWREDPPPSTVELTFHDREGTTDLELVHTQLDEASVPNADKHWNEFLDLLDELLANREIA